MRLSAVAAVALALALGLSLAGAAVFGGLLRAATPTPLVAELRVQAMVLPGGFSIDTTAFAANLVRAMQDRVRKDVGLTVLLGEEATKQLREAALPRLVNTDLMMRMLESMPGFAALASAPRLRSYVEIAVSNRGAVALDDVAITLPRLVLAEGVGDRPVEVKTTASGLPAAVMGRVAPGEMLRLGAWLEATPDEVFAQESQIRVGAREADGQAFVFGHRGWSGEDFETTVWGRWVVWAMLIGVALGAAGLLGLGLYRAASGRLRRRAGAISSQASPVP